jgi:hypothetical protein
MKQLAGHYAPALADARAAHTAFAPAAAKNPGLTEQQNALAQASASIAEILAADRQYAAGLRECDAAFPVLDGLYRAQPADAQAARALTLLLMVRGRIYEALGDRSRAAADWARGVELLSPHASDTDFVMLDPYARVLLLNGDADQARIPADRLRALGYRDRDFWNFWDAHTASRR